jgi:hypothetical protein
MNNSNSIFNVVNTSNQCMSVSSDGTKAVYETCNSNYDEQKWMLQNNKLVNYTNKCVQGTDTLTNCNYTSLASYKLD